MKEWVLKIRIKNKRLNEEFKNEYRKLNERISFRMTDKIISVEKKNERISV